MKNYIFPAVLSGLLLAGCSSAYRTGQTPDDVYYSSSPAVKAIVKTESETKDDGSYQSYWHNADDNYLRMKVQNGGRWNSLDDNNYWYGYNTGCQCNNNWGYYNSFNSFNNPWGYSSWGYNNYNYYNPWGMNSWYNGYNNGYGYWNTPVVVVTKFPTSANSSRSSLSGYNNNRYYSGGKSSSSKSGTNSSSNGLFRSIFNGNSNSGNSNSNSGSYDRPARTFDNSSSSGSSNSGGSSRSSGGSSGSSSGGSRGGRGG